MADAIQDAVNAALAQRDAEEATARARDTHRAPDRQITTEEADGYGHCPDPIECPTGSAQVPIKLIRETLHIRFGDRYGEFSEPGDHLVENDHSYLRVADPTDANCECGRARELSEQVRPKYVGFSGKDPAGLLKQKRAELGLAPDPVVAKEILDLKAELAEAKAKAA